MSNKQPKRKFFTALIEPTRNVLPRAHHWRCRNCTCNKFSIYLSIQYQQVVVVVFGYWEIAAREEKRRKGKVTFVPLSAFFLLQQLLVERKGREENGRKTILEILLCVLTFPRNVFARLSLRPQRILRSRTPLASSSSPPLIWGENSPRLAAPLIPGWPTLLQAHSMASSLSCQRIALQI